MEIFHNKFSDEFFIDMSRKEYFTFLNSVDAVLRGDSTATDRIILRNFLYKFGYFLQDI